MSCDQVIAGVSTFNDDGGGIGFDNFIYDVEGVPGTPGTVDANAPATLALLTLGLMLTYCRRKA